MLGRLKTFSFLWDPCHCSQRIRRLVCGQNVRSRKRCCSKYKQKQLNLNTDFKQTYSLFSVGYNTIGINWMTKGTEYLWNIVKSEVRRIQCVVKAVSQRKCWSTRMENYDWINTEPVSYVQALLQSWASGQVVGATPSAASWGEGAPTGFLLLQLYWRVSQDRTLMYSAITEYL